MKTSPFFKNICSAVRFFETSLIQNKTYRICSLVFAVILFLTPILSGVFTETESELRSSSVSKVFILNKTDYQIDFDAVAASNKTLKKTVFGAANFDEANADGRLSNGKLLLKISQENSNAPVKIETFCCDGSRVDDFSKAMLVSAAAAQIKKAQLSDHGAVFEDEAQAYSVTLESVSPYGKIKKNTLLLGLYITSTLLTALVCFLTSVFCRLFRKPLGTDEIFFNPKRKNFDFWGCKIVIFLNIVFFAVLAVAAVSVSRFTAAKLFGLADCVGFIESAFTDNALPYTDRLFVFGTVSLVLSAWHISALAEFCFTQKPKAAAKVKKCAAIISSAAVLFGALFTVLQNNIILKISVFIPFVSQLTLPIACLSGLVSVPRALLAEAVQIVFLVSTAIVITLNAEKQRVINE